MTIPPLRPAAALVGMHLFLSLTAIVVLVNDRDDRSVATTSAWVHGIIVAATAALLMTFALRAVGGSAAGYLRLRISSAVLFVALVVVVAVPGAFPGWMRALEAVSAACLLGVVGLANSRGARRALVN